MADENPHQGSNGDSSDPHKVYPDRSVLGGEVGLWSSDLNALPAPRAIEAASEIEELGYAALWFAKPWEGSPSPTPRCSSPRRAIRSWPPA